MKKTCSILLLCFCLILAGCNSEAETKGESDNTNDTFRLGEWKESRELDFSETGDGAVLVVDENEKTVLDIGKYPRTDILCDEFTGETRLIKTYTSAGTTEIPWNDNETKTVETYTLDYYDIEGNLLEAYSIHNIVSLSGAYGLDKPVDGGESSICRVYHLSTGKCLGDNRNIYLTENGIAVDQEQICTFYDAQCKEIHTEKGIALCAYPRQYRSYTSETSDYWGSQYGYQTLQASYGSIDSVYDDPMVTPPEEQKEYYDLLDVVKEPTTQKGDLIIFGIGSDLEEEYDAYGIVNSAGDIKIKANYCDFAYYGKNSLAAFGKEKTDLYSLEDFTITKSIPHCMEYYDGENAILKDGVMKYRLGNAEGNPLSDTCEEIRALNMGENGTVFCLYFPNNNDVSIVDRSGNTLFTLPYRPDLTYVGNNTIAVKSLAGFYTINAQGSITKIISLWEKDGYAYDKTKNEIIRQAN